MSITSNYIVHNIAPFLPNGLCNRIYRIYGLKNGENVRNMTYIQSLEGLHLGRNVFINRFCRIYNGNNPEIADSHIIIGDNVTIGYGTTIASSTHDIKSSGQRAAFRDIVFRPVVIGEGTWICANCIILPGVTVGKGCVIAAGSVVVKDCNDNCLYGGNPARYIKEL